MEIRLTDAELKRILVDSWDDHGLTVLDIPDHSCKNRLSISACSAWFGGSSVDLTPIEAAIVLEILDGPKEMQDVLDATFIDSDKSLHNHVSHINGKFAKRKMPFRVSCRGARLEILEKSQKS
jgi:hypothetical protein